MQLTPGERVVRCLCGEPVDRVPFGVSLGWYPWGETLERWRKESGNPELVPEKILGYDPSFALPSVHGGIHPGFPAETVRDEGDLVVFRDWRGILMRNRKDGGSMPEFLKYPVETPDDWERLKAERLDPSAPGRIAQDWPAFRARLAATGEAVQVGTFPFGIFGTPRDFLGVENLLVGFYEYPDMIRDMMDRLTTLWLTVWEGVAREVRIDHIHIWEDMSGRQGSLISPAMVRDFMIPCYRRITAFARQHGVRVISVDTDGDCSELVPLMMEAGVTTFLPFEVQAGNDIVAYRERYPTLGIMGGLDKRALAGTRAAIDREVARCALACRQGRYIPAFDHLIPPDVPWDAMVYAADRIRDVCHGV